MSLENDIKSLAMEAGFHAVGITSADPFPESEVALSRRFECGLLEGSGYDPKTIDLYTMPRRSFPEARSIISVALSYLVDDTKEKDRMDEGEPRGRVARFSRGLDYHSEMQSRLRTLAERIDTKLGRGTEIRSYCDTGPLADRSAAIRSGIGSRGKNTCIYVGKYRSWVILGELLTDIEMEPDLPAALDVCGECDQCVRACPTGAICAPYTVDVRICLSQVTQMKGFIPHRLREKLGTRIYGCDTCQSACPLNQDAKTGNVAAFHPSRGLGKNPELLPLLNISQQEFKERVGPTAAGWVKRTRFRRNVAVALGNIGNPVAVPALKTALSDTAPIIRAHSAWALGKIGGRDARLALEHSLSCEGDSRVKEEIWQAMGNVRSDGGTVDGQGTRDEGSGVRG